jgi:hypothetical protein
MRPNNSKEKPMKISLAACKKKLKSPLTTHVAAASAGAIVVAAIHLRMMDNGRTLVLSKEAFDALVNDETNFVRFHNFKRHEHAFRVSLEQWID